MMNPTKPPIGRTQFEELLYVPGIEEFFGVAARAWMIYTVLGLIAGISWKVRGAAPGVFEILGALGVALSLAPLILVPAWRNLMRRQAMHFPGPKRLLTRLANALAFWLISILISIAPLGVLLAFDIRQPAANVITDTVSFTVSWSAFFVLMLILAGPPIICLLSALLFNVWSFFGYQAGILVWLVSALTVNLAVFSGRVFSGFPLSLEGVKQALGDWGRIYSSMPLSLGELALLIRNEINLKSASPVETLYITDIVGDLTLWILLITIAQGVLLFLSQYNHTRIRPRLDPAYLSALSGTAVTALYAGFLAMNWAASESARYPGTGTGIFDIGIATLCVSYYCLTEFTFMPRSGNTGRKLSLLLALTPLLWVACTLPNLLANQLTRTEVLDRAAVSILVLLALLYLLVLLRRVTQGAGPLATALAGCAFLAVLIIPIPSQGTATAAVVDWLYSVLQRGISAFETRMIVIVFVLVLAWALPLVIRRKSPGRYTGA